MFQLTMNGWCQRHDGKCGMWRCWCFRGMKTGALWRGRDVETGEGSQGEAVWGTEEDGSGVGGRSSKPMLLYSLRKEAHHLHLSEMQNLRFFRLWKKRTTNLDMPAADRHVQGGGESWWAELCTEMLLPCFDRSAGRHAWVRGHRWACTIVMVKRSEQGPLVWSFRWLLRWCWC